MDARSRAGSRRAHDRVDEPSSGVQAPATPWARFSAWLECVCVVTFDLELGQALELVYPSDFRLTDKEKSSICYLSFPDSHSGCLGDTQFSFRIRQCGGQRSPWPSDDRHYNSEAPLSLQRESAHYFGYVYFRQVKDSSVKRGYFQKSLVLVSRLPFIRLFQTLLGLIAPEYFDKLAPCLEAVCNEIDQWPAPVPGQTLNLPVVGVVLQVHVPSRAEKPESSPLKQCDQENLLPAPMVLSSVHELDLFSCLQPVLTHVQTLWELMLLGEPLVVLAPSPTVSSEMVLALTRWGGGGCAGVPGAAGHPHICQMSLIGQRNGATQRGSRPSYLGSVPGRMGTQECAWDVSRRRACGAVPAQAPRLSWPLSQTPPQIRPFHQDDFLCSLEHAAPQLTCILKGDWLGLYRRFFKSPHFDGWYRQRRKEMAHKLEALHLEAICEANIETWMKGKSEVEVVDLVLKLQEKLVRAQGHQLPVKEATLQQARLYIETIMGSLPKDLQAILCPL
ncbi:PREDICTED: protein DENND6B [Miniopterus natalensis]|uniref:protein DENND6B n=1 Tax=Miniopterus natalensis TaxID=291302 RepID=UPI0007A70348|nr:PREDICTED: protein DENND6B [Miniopterus natalensis]